MCVKYPTSSIGKMKPCSQEEWDKPVVLHSAYCYCGLRPARLVCWCECRKNPSQTTQCRCGMKRVTVLCSVNVFSSCSRNGSGDILSSFLSTSQCDKIHSVAYDPAGLPSVILSSVILLTVLPSLGVPQRHRVIPSPSLCIFISCEEFLKVNCHL